MKKMLIFLASACLAAAVIAQTRGTHSARPTDAELKIQVVAFLNRSLGWQGLDKLEVQSIGAPDASGLRKVEVLLAKGDQHQQATYYITADGKEILEGNVSKLSGDPWAENRAKMDLRGAPVEGSATAPVTVVEYSDLECPYCKEAAQSFADLMTEDPGKFKLVFKYFPLTNIHPWSMQAAEAAVCVTQQHPDQFWNFAKTVFADQDQITVANAAQRLAGIAEESQAQPGPYQACLANPATKATIEASIANGKAVGVESTPTIFINGRPIPGALPADQLQLLIDHEAHFPTNSASAGLSTSDPKGTQCGECKPLPPIKH